MILWIRSRTILKIRQLVQQFVQIHVRMPTMCRWPGGSRKRNIICRMGSGIQWMTFTSDNTTKDHNGVRPYTNFTPTVNFMYNFSTTQHFRLNYSGRTGTPSPAQLQPIMTTFGQYQLSAGQSEPETAVHPIPPDVVRVVRSVHQKGILCDGECQYDPQRHPVPPN